MLLIVTLNLYQRANQCLVVICLVCTSQGNSMAALALILRLTKHLSKERAGCCNTPLSWPVTKNILMCVCLEFKSFIYSYTTTNKIKFEKDKVYRDVYYISFLIFSKRISIWQPPAKCQLNYSVRNHSMRLQNKTHKYLSTIAVKQKIDYRILN